MNTFPHGSAEWHSVQRNEQLRDFVAASRRRKDADLVAAVQALCTGGIAQMRQQSPDMMARVNLDALMAAMVPVVLAAQ